MYAPLEKFPDDWANDRVMLYALRGDQAAFEFCRSLFGVLHFWDDLHDRDVDVPKHEASRFMMEALVALPAMPFYAVNFERLSTALQLAIIDWKCANALEATPSQEDKQIAFIIRSSYINVALLCAQLVGGHDWAVDIAPALRRFFHGEGFATYLDELHQQFAKESQRVL